jgi:hypothetical protein
MHWEPDRSAGRKEPTGTGASRPAAKSAGQIGLARFSVVGFPGLALANYDQGAGTRRIAQKSFDQA